MRWEERERVTERAGSGARVTGIGIERENHGGDWRCVEERVPGKIQEQSGKMNQREAVSEKLWE